MIKLLCTSSKKVNKVKLQTSKFLRMINLELNSSNGTKFACIFKLTESLKFDIAFSNLIPNRIFYKITHTMYACEFQFFTN